MYFRLFIKIEVRSERSRYIIRLVMASQNNEFEASKNKFLSNSNIFGGKFDFFSTHQVDCWEFIHQYLQESGIEGYAFFSTNLFEYDA